MKYYGILILTVVLSVTGCRTMKPLKVKTSVAPLPVSRILRRVEAERRKIRTFKAKGVIHFSSRRFDGKGTLEILIKKPDSLKISIFGPFGIELGEALITSEKFFFYDAFKNKLFRGSNSNKIIKKIFKINFSFRRLLDALTGYANLTNNIYSTPVNIERNEDWFSVKFLDTLKNTSENFTIGLTNYKILMYSLLKAPDNLIVQNTFKNFQKINNINVPLNIEITSFNNKVNLKYRKVTINEQIKSLKLDVPDDAKIIRW